jgi:hypothetical protein
MSKAYRCDRCGAGFEGEPDAQIGHEKETEIRFRALVGIKYAPDNQDAPVHFKDLCPRCFADYINLFWKADPTPLAQPKEPGK